MQRLRALVLGRAPGQREDIIEDATLKAWEDMQVVIEAVDKLATDTATVQLGTLTGGTELGTVISSPLMASAQETAKLTAQRSEAIVSQLARRSTWLSSGRSLLRVTQRGVKEVEVSGSIPVAVTLRIPTTSLYVIEVAESEKGSPESTRGAHRKPTGHQPPTKPNTPLVTAKTAKSDKSLRITLKDIQQPIYQQVKGVGVMMGAVRVTSPSGLDWFQKEPDGYTLPVSSRPQEVLLWKNRRILEQLTFGELLSALSINSGSCQEIKSSTIGIYSAIPEVRQAALFLPNKEIEFLKALSDGKLVLKEHEKGDKRWYQVVSCSERVSGKSLNEPRVGKIWLGIQDKDSGEIQGFPVGKLKSGHIY